MLAQADGFGGERSTGLEQESTDLVDHGLRRDRCFRLSMVYSARPLSLPSFSPFDKDVVGNSIPRVVNADEE